MFYLSMVLAEDVETQIKGIVSSIVHAVGQSTEGSCVPMEATWKLSALTQALPMRTACLHLRQDSRLFLPTFSIIKVATGLLSRLRVPPHHGRFFL